MTEVAEGGGLLAWRLLATLEGGSLILATSALIAYTARNKVLRHHRRRRTVQRVLVTSTTCPLGRALKRQFETYGCTVVDDGISGADAQASKVDALVVVGAEPRANDLDGLANLVSDDVYDNLKLLDRLSSRVRRGGYISWACAGYTSGAFSEAAQAFDAALRASLQHAAKTCHCEPVWVGRCDGVERAAERVVTALASCTIHDEASRYSIRNAASKLSEIIGKWLKIIK